MCVFSIPQLNVKFRFDGVPRRNTMHEAHNTYYVNAKFIYVSIERMKKKNEIRIMLSLYGIWPQ